MLQCKVTKFTVIYKSVYKIVGRDGCIYYICNDFLLLKALNIGHERICELLA